MDDNKSPFGSLLGTMDTLVEELKEEEAREEDARIEEEQKRLHLATEQLSKKIVRASRKPITDAFLKAITPDEIATLVAKSARAGREWAIRLYVQYIQTPETLNRIGGEEDGEPVKIERLLATARDLGVDMDAVVREAESRLRGEYAVSLPDSPLGTVLVDDSHRDTPVENNGLSAVSPLDYLSQNSNISKESPPPNNSNISP